MSASASHAPRRPPPQPTPEPALFSVRFDGQTEDLVDLLVAPHEHVRDVLARIRINRPALVGRRLRLIHLGRILTDGIRLVSWMQTIRARAEPSTTAVAPATASSGKGKGPEQPRDGAIWLQCSIGEALEDGEEAQAPQLEPLRGFDRLREAGIPESEIEDMRRAFHERTGDVAGDDDEHARALEDAWVDGSTEDPSSSGAYTTLLKGAVLGFAVPIVPFFFFRTALFSRRFQMAIILGAVMNLAFGALRALN